jgi:hypothetical protein
VIAANLLVAPGVALFGQDEVPSVATVLAAVADDVAGIPDAVLCRMGEQETAATAVDTDDLRLGCQFGSWLRIEHRP